MNKDEQTKTQSLIANFFNGDLKAIEDLVLVYREGLILFVNGFVQNFEIAEDLASDTFAKLIVKKPKIKSDLHFKTYLFSMGKNLALTYLKKKKKILPLNDNIIANTTPDLLFIQNEQKRIIAEAINSLHKDYAEVLILRFYENLSVDQICTITNYNKKRVYNLLERSKKSLKEILEKEGFNFEDD